jgi:hypothetical protein
MRDQPGDAELLTWRVQAQWLARRPGVTVAAVAVQTAGLQAQERVATRLAVRARSRRLTADAVRRASSDERSVVRTWLMRGTLHLVAVEDVRWMLGLFGLRAVAADASRRAALGLDGPTCTAALTALPRILADESPLSRADLVDRLAGRGVAINPKGQAPAHLMLYAAAHGVLCRGPDLNGGEPGYVLLDEWAPAGPGAALDADAALAELARRYIAGYGPATDADLANWSGLPLGDARRGLAAAAGELTEIAEGFFVRRGARRPRRAAAPLVRLLGAFDSYLLGYRDRAPALEPRYARRIQAGGGIIHPAVLVDGRVAGTWRLRRSGGSAAVAVQPFEPLDPALLPAAEAEAADLGRFLGLDTRLTVG